MSKLLPIFAIAIALGLFSSAGFAHELGDPNTIANPFPEYTTIND